MQADGSVVVTPRMGRIDSEVGRKMAARDAAEAEKKRIAEAKAAEIAAAEEAKAAAKEAEKQAKLAAKAAKEHPETVAAAPTAADAAAAEAAPPPDEHGNRLDRHSRQRPQAHRQYLRQLEHDPEPKVSVSKELQTFRKRSCGNILGCRSWPAAQRSMISRA